jgi:hypothetical protein
MVRSPVLCPAASVETFGSMERREKADYLLEQVRLTLASGDAVKAAILGNKVARKQLDEIGMEASGGAALRGAALLARAQSYETPRPSRARRVRLPRHCAAPSARPPHQPRRTCGSSFTGCCARCTA